ncbi:hypothetical protein ACIBG8_48255 [Nonomuraea sp. NPDC050556]|uniref:hypothetical protein n=1 Tax=Nonomuraea sp. NPDC050556 TaxID=3364369 RepID=UPI003793E088
MRAVLVLACLLLSACTAAPPAPAPSAAGESAKTKKQRVENMKADCMKSKGFKYIPWVIQRREPTEGEKKQAEGDYAAMRADRARNGFYVYITFVTNKSEQGEDLVFESPNNKLTAKLSRTQQAAWYEAEGACFAEAAKVVYGKTVKDEQEFWKQYSDLVEKLAERELDGDQHLVELGRTFGDCLKAKGYKVTSLRPTDLAERGRKQVEQESSELGQKQQGSTKKLEEGSFAVPQLTPAEAKPYLDKEIKAALDDLDCGRDFYASFIPKQGKLHDRAGAEYGMG